MYKSIARTLSYLITALRPALGPRGICIYPLTCSSFACAILKEKPLGTALLLIAKRLLSCNPIGAYFLWR